MDLALLLAVSLAILLAGAFLFWRKGRRRPLSMPPDDSVQDLGYGDQRWKRELALWQGTLRRLEIQAKHRSPVPEGLQRQMDEARARIARAEKHLNE